MISFEHAKNTFHAFAGQFDISNPKIEIKVRHTYGVMEVCDYLAKSMNLEKNDYQLAVLIGLLHDVGRFEQLTRFNSYDDRLLPHAEAGLFVLFEKNHIRDYIETDKYDSVIYHAIKNHSLYEIDPALSGQDLLHARLIRDADKLDNFRVRRDDSISAILNISPEELGKTEISDKVFEAFLSHKTILKADRITPMDMWVTTFALIFDLNFPASFQYVLKHNFIRKIMDRVPYTNLNTAKKMDEIYKIVMEYIRAHV